MCFFGHQVTLDNHSIVAKRRPPQANFSGEICKDNKDQRLSKNIGQVLRVGLIDP